MHGARRQPWLAVQFELRAQAAAAPHALLAAHCSPPQARSARAVSTHAGLAPVTRAAGARAGQLRTHACCASGVAKSRPSGKRRRWSDGASHGTSSVTCDNQRLSTRSKLFPLQVVVEGRRTTRRQPTVWFTARLRLQTAPASAASLASHRDCTHSVLHTPKRAAVRMRQLS